MNNQDKTSEEITPKLPLWSYQLQQDAKLAVKTRKDLEIHLITRALKDEEFKQELIANPKALIEKELGAKLSEDLEIKVLEETENTLYLVLPCNPYEGISEEELKSSLSMTYEDVAQWVLEQQRNTLLDDESSVKLMARAWRDAAFKQQLQILCDRGDRRVSRHEYSTRSSGYSVASAGGNCGNIIYSSDKSFASSRTIDSS